MKETDVFAYMMAAEKVICLIAMMEQTLAFIDEYNIKADDDVKKELNPIMDKFRKWCND